MFNYYRTLHSVIKKLYKQKNIYINCLTLFLLFVNNNYLVKSMQMKWQINLKSFNSKRMFKLIDCPIKILILIILYNKNK